MIKTLTLRLVMALLVASALLVAPGAATSSTAGWCAALASGSPVVDVLGDSLSTGDAVANPSYRWTSLLGDSLRSEGAPGTQVWTGGAIDGSATADYVAGAKYSGHVEFTAHQPDLIMLGWGINDWLGGIPPAQFKDQYQQIISRIHTLAPAARLLLWHEPWVYGDLAASRGPQAPYRDVLRELAAVNGAQYVGTEWLVDGTDRDGQKTADGVHLNGNGQGRLYSVMRMAILAPCGRG